MISGVGGWVVRPPTNVQTPPEISANPLDFFMHEGGVFHVCIIVTFAAHQQRKIFRVSKFVRTDGTINAPS